MSDFPDYYGKMALPWTFFHPPWTPNNFHQDFVAHFLTLPFFFFLLTPTSIFLPSPVHQNSSRCQRLRLRIKSEKHTSVRLSGHIQTGRPTLEDRMENDPCPRKRLQFCSSELQVLPVIVFLSWGHISFSFNIYTHQIHLTHPIFFLDLDAYYILSNKDRRREYDIARKSHSRESWNAWSTSAPHHAEADTVFGGVFEELLRPEVQNPTSFYSPIGMVSGAALGFIVAGPLGIALVK